MRLLLFDVDGVLVHARGYRAALMKTVDWFAARMGLTDMTPTHADIDRFEANGLSSEWESCPLCIGLLILAALRERPTAELTGELSADLETVRLGQPRLQRPGYGSFAERVGQATPAGVRPTIATTRLLAGEAEHRLRPHQRAGFAAVLETLLADTHDLQTAWISQVFQHYSLGSEGYARCYRQLVQFETPSLLTTLDVPALSAAGRAQLRESISAGHSRAAIYTARPSLPPPGDFDSTGYAPEAELACDQIELTDLPLIGFGRMQWLAAQVGARPDTFVKPSPVQALAAIGAAWSGEEIAALDAAYAIAEHGKLVEPLSSLVTEPGLEVVVMEDSAAGVKAVARAVERLNSTVGSQVAAFRPIGISAPGNPKWAALQAECTAVFDNVNLALDALLVS